MIENGIKALISVIFMCFRSIINLGRIKFPIVTIISPLAMIRTKNNGRISIGSFCGIRSNSEIKADTGIIHISNHCFINRNCMIISHDSIIIEEQCTIGPGVYIYDHDHNGHGGIITKPIHIGARTWIGANCVILKGVNIGSDCIISAGSVISKNVPNNSLVIQKRNTYVVEHNH